MVVGIISKPSQEYQIFEKILIYYFAVLTLFIIYFSASVAENIIYIALNGLFVALILMVHYLANKTKNGGILIYLTPLILFPFTYTEAGKLVHLIYNNWFDQFFASLDQYLFGVNPALWIERFDYPILNELFRTGYGSYYFLIIGGAFIHFFYGHSEEDAHKMVTTITLGFCISYLLFIILPTQGPRFFYMNLFHTEMDGYVISNLQKQLIAFGGFRGGAFPSSHVAISLLVCFSLFNYHRRAFRIFTFFTVLLIIGTIWGRYHYVVDAVAGIILAIIVWKLYPLFLKKKSAQSENDHCA